VAASILRRERPDFVIPLVDEEIPIYHRLVSELLPDARVVTPRAEFCATMLDKWSTFRALDGAGLPVPRTWLASEAGDAVYPAVVKPRAGRGSRGVAYLQGPAELASYLQAAPLPADRYVVQARVDGTEFTVSVVVPLGGPAALAVVPKEVVDKRGSTVVGITRRHPRIEEMCRELQARLRADGPFNVQLIVDGHGVPRVIEVNPRYSTTVALTLGAGVDEVQAVLRAAAGEDPGPLAFTPDLAMLRYTAQLYVPAAEWPPNLFVAGAEDDARLGSGA
jgi:carbamoyl-phosphate synthase large subunit